MEDQTSGMEDSLAALARHLDEQLGVAVPNECIHLCGLAPLRIIATRPQEVLELADQKLRTWPYPQVPTCWRRLYEDASLHLATNMLRSKKITKHASTANGTKRVKLSSEASIDDKWLAEIVKVLDGAVVIAGAPGRRSLIDAIFHQLDAIILKHDSGKIPPQHLPITRPTRLQTDYSIQRSEAPLDFEAFQLHLDTSGTPIIIPSTFERWPARKLWSDVTYLQFRSLGGNRIVPVEIGASYNEDAWSQKMMPFKQFIETYLVPEAPTDIGYLAQHDLFAQIPALKNDISIPDYCYTNPPAPKGAAAQTAGLDTAQQLDGPSLNAWLGPAGTKTPLHTDPYHNILCQVVGYKYIRLYPPEETAKLYPSGVDESGINMSNTSQVDVLHFRPMLSKYQQAVNEETLREQKEKFPEFEKAQYQEAVLGPGDCLYIPLGYWHYVESLTASFSVSFWWN